MRVLDGDLNIRRIPIGLANDVQASPWGLRGIRRVGVTARGHRRITQRRGRSIPWRGCGLIILSGRRCWNVGVWTWSCYGWKRDNLAVWMHKNKPLDATVKTQPSETKCKEHKLVWNFWKLTISFVRSLFIMDSIEKPHLEMLWVMLVIFIFAWLPWLDFA